MLFLIEGEDYIWKLSVMEWAVAAYKWPSREVIYADEVEEKWLVSQLNVRNHIVVRNCHVLTDMAGDRVKDWRTKDFIFETTGMQSCKLKRRIQRIGKWVQCVPGSEELPQKIEILADRMGLPALGKKYARGFSSLTDAYWYLTLWKLGSHKDPPGRMRHSLAWYMSQWDPAIVSHSLDELILTVRGLAKMSIQARLGKSKWELVQEAIRTDSTQVSGLYAVTMRMADNVEETTHFLNRAVALSTLLEEGYDPPMEYAYLRLR